MNIAPYLDILVKNEKIFEALKNKYPDILADLTSAKFNPTCSCRGRVATHLNKKYTNIFLQNISFSHFCNFYLRRQFFGRKNCKSMPFPGFRHTNSNQKSKSRRIPLLCLLTRNVL